MDSATASLIRHARSAAPYFTKLYSKLPADPKLEDVPVIDHASYWAAGVADASRVMTGPHLDGVVMRTGGTTSRPKVTAYSQAELQRTASLLASGLLAGGVRAGDRIANMFYAGSMYGSFLLHVLSIMAMPVPVVHVPVGGPNEASEAIDMVRQTGSTVLLTTATSLVKMAHHLIEQSNGQTIDEVRCVLFGGEPLFPEQDQVIRKAFPRASVKSCIYGSIDAGVLATAGPGEDARLHRAFTDTVVLEIIDDGGSVIHEPGVPGVLVATNTLRQLCPVIRYPTGDRAAWVDEANGLFNLIGRASQAVRLGPVSVDVTDLRKIVAGVVEDHGSGQRVLGVQAILARADGLDQLQCAIALHPILPDDAPDSKQQADAVLSVLYQQRPMLRQHVDLGLVAPAIVRFVPFADLSVAKGSHKVRDVVDTRFDSSNGVAVAA